MVVLLLVPVVVTVVTTTVVKVGKVGKVKMVTVELLVKVGLEEEEEHPSEHKN